MDGEQLVNLELQRISKEKVRTAMKRMTRGKEVDTVDITVEIWSCL